MKALTFFETLERCQLLRDVKEYETEHQANFPFPYPLKTSKNQRFSNVSGGYSVYCVSYRNQGVPVFPGVLVLRFT